MTTKKIIEEVTITCDRCKKEINNNVQNNKGRFVVCRYNSKFEFDRDESEYEPLDLCVDCAKIFLKIFESTIIMDIKLTDIEENK